MSIMVGFDIQKVKPFDIMMLTQAKEDTNQSRIGVKVRDLKCHQKIAKNANEQNPRKCSIQIVPTVVIGVTRRPRCCKAKGSIVHSYIHILILYRK